MPPRAKKRPRVSEAAEAAAAPAPIIEPLTIVCFGDSNTHGASSEPGADRLPHAARWTTILQADLGDGVLVVPEGLNGRTTVLDDPNENPFFCGQDGAGMNGRRQLLPCLHSHKPVSVVVIALGCNDMKTRHGCTADDITFGLNALIVDVRQSHAGPEGSAPKIVVISPPLCHETTINIAWGFKGCGPKSKQTIAAYKRLAAQEALPFVDLGSTATVGSDGIHFQATAGQMIGAAVAAAVKRAMAPAKKVKKPR